MADLTLQQKKDYAATLYLKENLTQQEIADRVGVSRRTIQNWINKEKWEERKVALTITREQQIASLYKQVAAINMAVSQKEEGQRFPNPGEADTLNKLASAIRKMETDAGIADIVSVGIRFTEFIRQVDHEKAKEISRLFDLFIKSVL